MMKHMKKTLLGKGFTLVEVLVVISIIGILSSILYVSFGESKEMARNKAIQAELKEVQLALELYKSQNGRYPEANTSCDTEYGFPPNNYFESDSVDCVVNALVPSLIPDFIAELPVVSDSANSNCNFIYQTDSGGSWYRYVAEQCAAGVDSTTGTKAGDEFAPCLTSCDVGCDPTAADFYESYAVYSFGGECQP